MIKKRKAFLAPDLEKETKWLTEMSEKGLQFYQYTAFTYYFEENKEQSFVYQVDFQEATEEYFDLYKDAGWEYVSSSSNAFHYFRTDKQNAKKNPIYTDTESMKNLYQRMLTFYGILFLVLFVSMMGNFLNWKGLWLQKALLVLVIIVGILYLWLFASLYRKIKKYDQ